MHSILSLVSGEGKRGEKRLKAAQRRFKSNSSRGVAGAPIMPQQTAMSSTTGRGGGTSSQLIKSFGDGGQKTPSGLEKTTKVGSGTNRGLEKTTSSTTARLDKTVTAAGGTTSRMDQTGGGQATTRELSASRRDKRLATTAKEEEDKPKLKIIKTEVGRVVIEKKPKEERAQATPDNKPADTPLDAAEKKKRQGRVKLYRGNMHLIQRANREAAKSVIGGKKTTSKKQKKKKKEGETKRRSAWDTLMRRIFGVWVQEEVVLRNEKAKAAVQALDMTQTHLKKMKWVFDEIDIDGSGTIDVDELFDHLHEKRSPLTDALFAMIDMDGNGVIEFDEFVRVIGTYCMYTEEDILRFCFDCFDKDGSGTIDETEFISLCQTVNNADPMYSGNFRRALEEFDVDADGLVDFLEFCNLYRKYPMMLFPAFRLQDSMQRITLGERDWKKLHENIENQRQLLEYRAMHDGKDPPVTLGVTLGRIMFPCLFPKIKISPALLAEAAASQYM